MIFPVGLWEKFVEQSIVLDNSRRFVGKFRWTQKATGKYPQIHWKNLPDYLRLFAKVLHASHNVYLTENSPKLETVHVNWIIMIFERNDLTLGRGT